MPRRNVNCPFLRESSLSFNITETEVSKKKPDTGLLLSSLVQKCEPQARFAIEQVKMY